MLLRIFDKNDEVEMDGISKRIKYFVDLRDLTYKDVARKSGIKYTTLVNMLKRNKSYNADFCIAIAKAFNLNLYWLLTGEGEMERNPRVLSPAQSKALKEENLYLQNKIMEKEKEIIQLREKVISYQAKEIEIEEEDSQ